MITQLFNSLRVCDKCVNKILSPTWFNTEINEKGTIHYFGDWSNEPRPSSMLGSRTATPAYLEYSIYEYTHIQLYELVRSCGEN